MQDLFTGALTGPIGIVLEIVGLISVVLLFKLPWTRWLRRATGAAAEERAAAVREWRHA